jgi:hypothetical protein
VGGVESRDPLSGGGDDEETEGRWVGKRGKVDEAVLESRTMRRFYHTLDRQREDADEINRIRSSRSVPGGASSAGAGSARNRGDGKSNSKRTSWDKTLVESSSERMERLRGDAPAPAEDQV